MCVGVERIKAMDTLNAHQRSVGWGLGAAQQDQLSKQAVTPALIRLYQLLLLTMPGTPVFTYGDEIGLQAGQVSHRTEQISSNVFCNPAAVAESDPFFFFSPLPFLFLYQSSESPEMVWDIEKEPAEGAVVNETVEVKVCSVIGCIGKQF